MFRSATTRIAHKSATFASIGGNKDLQALQSLLDAEKNLAQSIQKLSSDYDRVSEALRMWGAGEGDDLADVLNGAQILMSHYSGGLVGLVVNEEAARGHMKAVRSREESLDEMRRRRRNLGSQADNAERKLSKMGSEHKNLVAQTDQLNRLREEIRILDSEIMSEEARVSDFKRHAAKEWMTLKLGGLSELSSKGLIAGDFGKALVQEIPQSSTQPGLPRAVYSGGAQTQKLLMDAHEHVLQVKFSPLPPTNVLNGGVGTMPPRGVSDGKLSYAVPPAPDMPPTIALSEHDPSLDLNHIISPTRSNFSPMTPTMSKEPAPAQSYPKAADFAADRRASMIDEFGGIPPPPALSNPPSHFRSGAQYEDNAASVAAATVGGRAQPGTRQAAGSRFATFPVKGARPRGDSAADASSTRTDDTGSYFAQSSLEPQAHTQQYSASSYDSTTAPTSQMSSGAAVATPPPWSSSATDSTPRLPLTGRGFADQPPTIAIPRSSTADSDFATAVTAALGGGYTGSDGSPATAPAVSGQPGTYVPTSYGATGTPQSATFEMVGYHPSSYVPTSYDAPTSLPPSPLPPGAAPPISPPNKNYELSSPVSVTGRPLPSIQEAHPPQPESSSPVSLNRRSWNASQPSGPATSIPMPPTMPPLIERPTAESFMTIETPRSEMAPAKTGAHLAEEDEDEEDSQLSYMSPTRASQALPQTPAAVLVKTDKGDRRVRFGEVTVSGDEHESDEDEDEGWMKEADEDEEQSQLQDVKQRPNSAFVRGPAPVADDDDEDEPKTPRPPQSFQQPQPPSPPAAEEVKPRTPTPPMTEESLDAAAAREIAQELNNVKSFMPGSNGNSGPPPPPPSSDKPVSPQVRTDFPAARGPSSPPSSFQTSPTRGRNPLPAPPAISLPRPSFSANSSVASFSTPMEYPSPPPLGMSKLSSRSNLSLNGPTSPPAAVPSPSYPTGGAKISAAAFRRAQGSRNPSNSSPADTTPLNIAKRSLPSSPYPTRAQSPAVPLDVPGVRPTSAYSTADSDFANDYISSYMTSSPTTEAPPDRRSGYGLGTYATNLEQDKDSFR